MTTNAQTIKPQTTLAKVKYLVMLNSILLLFIGTLLFFNQPKIQKVTNPVLVEQSDPSSQPIASLKNDELAGLPYVSHDHLQQQAKASYQQVAVIQTQQQPRVRARSSR